MDAAAELIGLTSSEFMRLIVIAVVLLVGLGVLRALFKLTKTALKIGCFLILFIVFGGFVVTLLS